MIVSPDGPVDLTLRSTEVLGLEALNPVVSDWPRIDIEPLRGPMGIKTFVSPDCSYASIRDLLRSAEEEILLYIYNVSAQHMLDLLAEALDRGVKVRIMYDKMDTRGSEEAKLQALDGAELRVAPSKHPRRAFTFCHQKFLVIDRRVVVVESANWATTSIPKIETPGVNWRKGNREWFLQLASEPAAEFFAKLFETDWEFEPEVAAIELEVAVPFERGLVLSSAFEAAPSTRFTAREFNLSAEVELVPICSPQNYLETVLPLIQGAKESLCIEQQYIQGLDEDGHVIKLVQALEALPAKVDVRIVGSSVYQSSWDKTVETLKAHGLEDRLRAINLGIFKHNHNKGLIVDGRSVLVSSTNWSDNSIGAAREAGVLVHDSNVAGYYQGVFDLDWETGWSVAQVDSETTRMETTESTFFPQEEEIHPADLV